MKIHRNLFLNKYKKEKERKNKMKKSVIIFWAVLLITAIISLPVYADSILVSEDVNDYDIRQTFSGNMDGMTLVEKKQISLNEEYYIETECYEKELNNMMRTTYKTKIGTYTYRVRNKKTDAVMIKYVLTGKFRYNGKKCSCVEALGKTTHVVKNKFTVLNDSAVASGDTAIGYFYCKSISNGQTFGGTFKIRISPNGKITFP